MIKEIKQFSEDVNKATRPISDMLQNVVDLFGGLLAVLPILEITAVLVALVWVGIDSHVVWYFVFSQVSALYVTSRYSKIPMTFAGRVIVWCMVAIAAVSTGIAAYLSLVPSGIDAYLHYGLPTMGGLVMLGLYSAKMSTAEFINRSLLMDVQGQSERKEAERAAASLLASNQIRDDIQQTRLEIQRDSMSRLAADPTIKHIQDKAMYGTLVKEMMDQYDIKPHSNLGKEILALAKNALNGGLGDIENLVNEASLPGDEPPQNGRVREDFLAGAGGANGRHNGA